MQLGYANVMSTIAVFVALGGSSYAVATGSVGSRALRDDSVRSVDLRDNGIRGADVRKDTITGTDVIESTLGTVPSATTAVTATAAETAAHARVATDIAAPEDFHRIGAPGEPAFNPQCRSLPTSTYEPVGFYKDREGLVHLRGAFSCDGAGQIAFNLPPGYRPPPGKEHFQAIVCLGGPGCGTSLTAIVEVWGSGFGPGADGALHARADIAVLDGVSFRAAS
jgi:hypothetical protein